MFELCFYTEFWVISIMIPVIRTVSKADTFKWVTLYNKYVMKPDIFYVRMYKKLISVYNFFLSPPYNKIGMGYKSIIK